MLIFNMDLIKLVLQIGEKSRNWKKMENIYENDPIMVILVSFRIYVVCYSL